MNQPFSPSQGVCLDSKCLEHFVSVYMPKSMLLSNNILCWIEVLTLENPTPGGQKVPSYSPEEWMALLLFCITSINAPTIPEVGAGVGGALSWPSDTF